MKEQKIFTRRRADVKKRKRKGKTCYSRSLEGRTIRRVGEKRKKNNTSRFVDCPLKLRRVFCGNAVNRQLSLLSPQELCTPQPELFITSFTKYSRNGSPKFRLPLYVGFMGGWHCCRPRAQSSRSEKPSSCRIGHRLH